MLLIPRPKSTDALTEDTNLAGPTDDFWQLESLRLTAFVADPVVGIDEVDWWKRLAGSPPEQSAADRTRDTIVQAGAFPGETHLPALLRLVVEPLRAQWDLVPPPQSEPFSDWSALGSWEQVVPPFHDMMQNWFSFAPPVNRVAFGAVLHAKVSDRREGYERLAGFLPFPIDLESSDFLLQTNKPANSTTVEGLALNRLTKWAVVTVQTVLFPLVVASLPAVARTSHMQTACRLELDMSTAAERVDPLPPEALPGVWDELEQLARGIADEGITRW